MPGTQLQEDEAHTKMLTLSEGCYRVHRRHGFSSVSSPASTGPVDTGGREGRQGKPHTGSSPAGRALAEMSRTVLCDQTSYKGSQGECEPHTSCKKGTAIAVRHRISLASPTYKVVGCVLPKFKIAI